MNLLPACRILTAALLLALAPYHAAARVVINEVMYHPPEDRDDLQWVELLNTGAQPVDLAGWTFAKGFQFTFTNTTVLPPHGFLVVARDRGAFVIQYGTNLPVVGDFKGRLSHGGERIELIGKDRALVDAVEFGDASPWPSSPDGLSPSLERVVPEGPGDAPENWAPSPLPKFETPSGTPGRANAAVATNLPPIIRNVRWGSPTPDHPIPITAEISDIDGLDRVTLLYRILPVTTLTVVGPTKADQPEPKLVQVPMTRSQGNAQAGTYTASIPGQTSGQLVRFHIQAVDRTGSARIAPHPHDARPTWSVFVHSITNSAAIPFAFLTQFGPAERPGQSLRNMDWNGRGGRRNAQPTEPARGDAALVYLPPGTSEASIFDHIRITPRQGGWKVRLQKDQLLDGMSTVNLLFEFQPRFVLAEHLAYETYRRAGVPTPQSGHWRAWYNGRPVGYHLFVEQPNSTFLRRNQRDPDGDLFKLIWYGGDLIGQHEKKNNPETGHAALVQTVEALNKAKGAEQWRVIEGRFNVPEFINYFAVNMLIQNWDGFFNNYFLYRTRGAAGKWEIIPWDEDKTWGDFDGSSPQYDWYSMPLSFGMAGDQPKMKLSERFLGSGGPHGGPSWWRHPGWFSGPLLANPEFRARFKTRLRELLQNEFTPDKLEPLIARLEHDLEPEVRYRAQVVGTSRNEEIAVDFGTRTDSSQIPKGNPTAALSQFQRHIQSFRGQVKNRRTFLLQELDREP